MQQVNLYQPILRKQEKVFSLKTLLQGNLVIFAVLSLFYFITLYQTHNLREQHAALKVEHSQRLATLAELQQRFPPRKKDPQLAERVARKQALLDHRQRLIQELQHQNTGAGGNPGFSEQLSGLARQDVQAIWFDRISVRDGKQLTLQGWATSPEEVPRLITRLTDEPSFSGTAFNRVQISRHEETPGIIGFTLRTADATEGEEETAQ